MTMVTGRQVFRVVWSPGDDTLLGTCHCGATRLADEPADLWDWLLGHPAGHGMSDPEVVPDPPRAGAGR